MRTCGRGRGGICRDRVVLRLEEREGEGYLVGLLNHDKTGRDLMQKTLRNLNLPMNFTYICSTGKVQRTISNHPYMRLHIDKWKENGASPREIVLLEYLRKNI